MSATTRNAGLLIACAVAAAALAMGLRQSFGLFLAPMTAERGWSTSGFALAIAFQVLLNGFAQPLAGQVADRIGARPVVLGGAILYAAGILGMALSEGLPLFTFFAGVVMGVAVAAAGMPVISAALTRGLPEHMRGRAVGLGTAGSSFGQFLVVPLSQLGINLAGWQGALFLMAGMALLMVPLSLPLGAAPAPPKPGTTEQTAGEALRAATSSPSFWCLFAGFFVCGVHVSFLAVHLPGFVATCHLPASVGAASIALIGLFNVVGSLGSGELSQRWKRRELLVAIYALRGVLMAVFLYAEKTTTNVLIFSAFMGILWLSTVPPTVALCARNWGTRWLATIFGIVFLGHQLGGFTGAFLGGYIFDLTGSYDLMWSVSIAFAAFAAFIHLPIKDGPIKDGPTKAGPPSPVPGLTPPAGRAT
ncbi:MFS transporter [Roseococcus sp. SYP-B2431]|uniref:MFS transporter n=1 Tax=Roseococcus sp. SYP-B2431 TaxID=2496640 RepID=UPI00103C078C|nr:MFS transporter [Roseococcus sp. SYP-B2431]TCI00017.1 MFS transporter [Roseococcus sp. SYP-B2431]